MDREQKEIVQVFFSNDAENIFEKIEKFSSLMIQYSCAVREIRTKFEVLNEELSFRAGRNPIESISSRIKKPVSIAEKLKRRGIEPTLEAISSSLNDVAGIRVVCSFIDDIYRVADMLAKQDDITVVQIKDYIKKPKQNGYRSYHMIVEVPVFFSESKLLTRVEIQFRTVAMDFWASLEHSMKYKKQSADRPDIAAELKSCAETIAATDARMLGIRKRIEALESEEK